MNRRILTTAALSAAVLPIIRTAQAESQAHAPTATERETSLQALITGTFWRRS